MASVTSVSVSQTPKFLHISDQKLSDDNGYQKTEDTIIYLIGKKEVVAYIYPLQDDP